MLILRSTLAALAAVICATAVGLGASTMMMTPQQTMHGMIGRWTCVAHDSTHKTSRETDVYSMWGAWLRDDTTFSAQNGGPSGSGLSLMRYDAQHGRWVIMGGDTTGGYFTATSTAHALNGSHWTDAYPADGGWANVHMSANQMTVDSGGPDMHGHMMTTHDVCTRG